MGESRSFRNSTSSRVENQLKTSKLRMRKIEKERVAVVYLGMNERCSDSFSCSRIEVFLIRRRSRIDRKQALETEEI